MTYSYTRRWRFFPKEVTKSEYLYFVVVIYKVNGSSFTRAFTVNVKSLLHLIIYQTFFHKIKTYFYSARSTYLFTARLSK